MTGYIEEKIPFSRRIFCNRNLRLDRIKTVGFDMDYTLALYHEAMEHLQAEMVLERLVGQFGYGREVLAAAYDPLFSIRGLTVDTQHGNVLKMDSHRFVGRVWHGDSPLDRSIRRQTYTNRKVQPGDPNYVMVDTLFALPEIHLYCQLVALYEARPPEQRPSFPKLWHDLRNAMDSLHRDGTLKARIMQDIPRYIRKDPELAETLHRFRSAGKRLFILTNSEAPYTQAVMSFLLDGTYAGYSNWMDFFDFVITSSRKPAFFVGDAPLVEVDAEGNIADEPTTTLRRGQMYHNGNLADLTRLTGVMGEDVLYVGDHIYGDITRSKRDTGWRTAMVIQEMDRELETIQARGPQLAELDRLEHERFQVNLERTARAVDGDKDTALKARAKELTGKIAKLEGGIAEDFNERWGMLLRDRAELSAFGAQVENYACVYTSRVSNFRLYSPVWYFRSPRDRMAHEGHL